MGTFNPGGSIPTGASSLGAEVVTVGAGGNVSTLADAVTAVNAKTRFTALATAVCSVTGTVGGSVDVRSIVADSGTPFGSFAGRMVAVQMGGAGAFFLAQVFSGARLFVLSPIHSDITSQSFTIYSFVPAVIFMLPGTNLTARAKVSLPKFTTLFGFRGTCSITFNSLAALDSITPGDATETREQLAALRLRVENEVAGKHEQVTQLLVALTAYSEHTLPLSRRNAELARDA